jgi:hypothetical protein
MYIIVALIQCLDFKSRTRFMYKLMWEFRKDYMNSLTDLSYVWNRNLRTLTELYEHTRCAFDYL